MDGVGRHVVGRCSIYVPTSFARTPPPFSPVAVRVAPGNRVVSAGNLPRQVMRIFPQRGNDHHAVRRAVFGDVLCKSYCTLGPAGSKLLLQDERRPLHGFMRRQDIPRNGRCGKHHAGGTVDPNWVSSFALPLLHRNATRSVGSLQPLVCGHRGTRHPGRSANKREWPSPPGANRRLGQSSQT